MNWDALGEIGEVFGAIVVVGTLLYLSRQISQQIKAATTQNMSSWLSDYNGLILRILDDGEVTDIIRRGFADFGTMNGREQMRFHAWMITHVLSTQNLYLQQRTEVMNEDITEMIVKICASIIQTDGGEQWWRHAKLTLEPEFVTEIDRNVEIVPPLSEVYPWAVMSAAELMDTPNKSV